MSRNFRAAQLLDAFEFGETNQIIEQLNANFTNVLFGTENPVIVSGTTQEGNIYFQTTNNALYICENTATPPAVTLAWTRITQTQQTITQLLEGVPTQQAFVYTADPNYDADNSNAQYDAGGQILYAYFTTGSTAPEYLYGFDSARRPGSTATPNEPDLVLRTDGNGFLNDGAGHTGYEYHAIRGSSTSYSGGGADTLPDRIAILYSRPATGVTPNDEVLVRVDDGTFEFREPAIGSQYAQTGTNNADLHALAEITFPSPNIIQFSDGTVNRQIDISAERIGRSAMLPTSGRTTGDLYILTTQDGTNEPGIYYFSGPPSNSWIEVANIDTAGLGPAIVDNGSTSQPTLAMDVTREEIRNLLKVVSMNNSGNELPTTGLEEGDTFYLNTTESSVATGVVTFTSASFTDTLLNYAVQSGSANDVIFVELSGLSLPTDTASGTITYSPDDNFRFGNFANQDALATAIVTNIQNRIGTSPWTVTMPRNAADDGRVLVFTGRDGVAERAITGNVVMTSENLRTNPATVVTREDRSFTRASNVVPAVTFDPGLYIRTATAWTRIANEVLVDSALSSTSLNPVENRVINTQVANLNQAIANAAGNTLPFSVQTDDVEARGLDYTVRDDNDYDVLVSIGNGLLTFTVQETSPTIALGQHVALYRTTPDFNIVFVVNSRSRQLDNAGNVVYIYTAAIANEGEHDEVRGLDPTTDGVLLVNNQLDFEFDSTFWNIAESTGEKIIEFNGGDFEIPFPRGTVLPAAATTGSFFFLSAQDTQVARGRETFTFALPGATLDRINTAGANWTMSVTNLTIPAGDTTGTLTFADATVGARTSRADLATEIAQVINTQLVSVATRDGLTNPWLVSSQLQPGSLTNYILVFSGRTGTEERDVSGTITLDGDAVGPPTAGSTVEEEQQFPPGLYIRTAPGTFASNRDWELVAPLNSDHEQNGLTFVADDSRNMTGVARTFENINVVGTPANSPTFEFTSQGIANEFRQLFLPDSRGRSTETIMVRYLVGVTPTTYIIPLGTTVFPVAPLGGNFDVIFFFNTVAGSPGFADATSVTLEVIDNVPDTIHTNELHITSPLNTISSDVTALTVSGQDQLRLDVAQGSLGPNRMNIQAGQDTGPGNILVTGTTANNDFTTAAAHDLIPHAFEMTSETITWNSLCTYTVDSINGVGRTGVDPITTTNFVSTTIASFTEPLVISDNNRIMHPNFRTFLNDTLTAQTGNQNVTWEPNRLYAIRPVATTFDDATVPPLSNGGWTNAGGTDQSRGQVMWFRTPTTLTAGNLPLNFEWLNDNVLGGQINLTNFRFAIYDFGTQGNINTELARAVQSFDVAGTDHHNIELSSPIGTAAFNAFAAAQGTQSPPHQVYTALPTPNSTILVRIVDVGTSANSTGVVIDLSSKLIDDGDGTFSVGSPTGWIKMSPQNQALYTFSPHNANDTVYFGSSDDDETNANIIRRVSSNESLFSDGVLSLPNHGTLNSREVHRIRASGTTAGAFTPEFRQFRLTVPATYEVNTVGSTTGTLLRTTGNIDYVAQGVFGNAIIINTPNDVGDVFTNGLRVSPNANGFPNTRVAGDQAGTLLRLEDGSIFSNGNNFYAVQDVNPTVITFDLSGPAAFGTAMDGRLVTASDLTLSPRISAVDFLTALAAGITAEWTEVTVAQTARIDPTDSSIAEIILDTNQMEPITIDFDLNDESATTDSQQTRLGTTVGSEYTASFSDPANPQRDFSVSISTTQPLTTTQLLNQMRTSIEMQTGGSGWTTLVEGDDLILTSVLSTPSAVNIQTSATNRGTGNIGLFAQELVNGGTRAVAIGEGLRVNSSGVLSTDIPALGFVGPVPLREDTANLNNGVLTFTTAPDQGVASQAFVNRFFSPNPTQGDLVNQLTTLPLYIILLSGADTGRTTNVTRLVPVGTPVTYTNSTATVTLGSVLRDVGNEDELDIELRLSEQIGSRLDLFPGRGIAFQRNLQDDTLLLSQSNPTNPTVDSASFEITNLVRQGGVQFSEWILTGGFAFPEAGSGTITISDNNPTMSAFSFYTINNQNYYFIDELNGGTWIVGSVTNGSTYTTTQLNQRLLATFGT